MMILRTSSTSRVACKLCLEEESLSRLFANGMFKKAPIGILHAVRGFLLETGLYLSIHKQRTKEVGNERILHSVKW